MNTNCTKWPFEPDLSIIIPIFNIQDWVAQCIESAQRQTGLSLEIICVLDGPEDDSAKIVLDSARTDSRIRVLAQENIGLSGARNAGASIAKGRYVVFLDGDDYWRIDAIKTVVDYADKNSLDVLLFDAEPERESGVQDSVWSSYAEYYKRSAEYERATTGIELIAAMRERWDYLPAAWLYIVRRSFMLSSKVHFLSGFMHEDNPFTFALLLRARRAAHINVALYARRLRPGSIMTSSGTLRSVAGMLFSYGDMVKQLYEVPVMEPYAKPIASIASSLMEQAAKKAVTLSNEDLVKLELQFEDAGAVVAYSNFRLIRDGLVVRRHSGP